MKTATMLISVVGEGWGALIEGGFVGGRRLLDGRFGALRQVVAAGMSEAALDEAAGCAPESIDELTYLPVIPDPAHILCCGINYADHAVETGRESGSAPRIFLRAASSMVGHMAPLLRPGVSTEFDFEGELAVIIGRAGKDIPEDQAMAHVAGYTCFMDGSVRDWQRNTTTLGKNFDGTGALGPGMVPARAVPDWRDLDLVTRVNGQQVQRTGTDRMIHTIPATISYLSRMCRLEPGDVIATGTPDGIGARREPPLWLRPGDLVEVEVSGVGLLANRVVDA